MKRFYYIIGFILLACFSIQAQEQTLFISTGSYGGNYHKVGKLLDKHLDIPGQYNFKTLSSKGSNQNIENLKDQKADLALVQRDILLKNIYGSNDGIKNLEVLAPIYEEKFLIYCHDSTLVSIDSLRKDFMENESIKIGVTSKNTSSYTVFNKIANYLNLPLNQVQFIEGNYARLMRTFKKEELDYLVTFSLPLEELDTMTSIHTVYFNKNEMDLLDDRFTDIHKTKLNDSTAHFTLGSWTFLVGLTSSIEFLPDTFSVKKALINNTEDYPFINNQLLQSFELFQNQPEIRNRFFSGLNQSRFLKNDLNIVFAGMTRKTFTGLIFFILLLIILLFWFKIITWDNFIFVSSRYQHILIGMLIVGVLYIICVEYMMAGERQFLSDMGIKSPLLNMTKSDLHFWIIITNLAQNDNGIFPLSSQGQIMLTLTAYLLIIGSLFIGLSEYLFRLFNKKRLQGIMKIKYKNHIVITGWNHQSSKLIEELENATYNYNLSKERIVFVGDHPEKILEGNKALQIMHRNKHLSFVHGDIREEEVLVKSNISNCATVVLLAEDNTPSADEKTLLRALAISRHCRKISTIGKPIKEMSSTSGKDFHHTGKYIDSIYIIAELNDKKYKSDLINADVNEVVSSATYGRNIITQTVLNHGVSKVMDEILQFNEFNEFYTIDLKLKENEYFQFKTYDELLYELRTVGILLIGIKVIYRNQYKKEIIDDEALKHLLSKDGLSREIIINPVNPKEKNRLTDGDDKLIVFAQNRKSLQSGIKKLAKKKDSQHAKPHLQES